MHVGGGAVLWRRCCCCGGDGGFLKQHIYSDRSAAAFIYCSHTSLGAFANTHIHTVTVHTHVGMVASLLSALMVSFLKHTNAVLMFVVFEPFVL